MLKKTKIKISIFFIATLIILPAVYFDYLYSGYKSPVSYFVTCLFAIMIFFAGISVGEWVENVYGDKK